MIPFKILAASLSIGGILLFSGCSVISAVSGAKGQEFVEFKKPQENHGVVYVYRPRIFVGGGITYDVHVSNETTSDIIVGELLNAGYFEIDLPIGVTDIWAKVDAVDSVTLDIKNGKIYCVKSIPATIEWTLLAGPTTRSPNFETVDLTTCKSEIITTRNSK